MKRPHKCGIYCIRNKINNKILVGSSVDIFHRFACHKNKLRYNIHNNPHIQNAWNHYGQNNFIFEIIEECEPEKLINMEDYYIIQFNTLNREFGYNLNLASRHTQNEESKEKIRQSRLGKRMNEEQKKKLSITHTGKIRGPYSKEHKQKISLAHKGKPMTPYQKQRWLEAIHNRTDLQKQELANKIKKGLANMPPEKREEMYKKMSQAKLGKKRGHYKPRKTNAPSQ